MKNTKHLTVKIDEMGVARVVIDVIGRPMNVLDHDVMRELDSAITELGGRRDLKLIVFKSGKESGFLAGADVQLIQKIESAAEADALLLSGQQLFDRIEQLPTPTLVLIHGPCLGGGLELSLACDYRLARADSSTQIGLPEIKLGLIPGWGGTQRLPRKVGLVAALEMILKGKHLSAADAAEIGLVDQAIAPDQWRNEVASVIETLASGKRISKQRSLGQSALSQLQSLPLVRDYILSKACEGIRHQVEHYPALASAVKAIRDSFQPGHSGYLTERLEFGKLIKSATSRHLLRLFFSRERARQRATWVHSSETAIHHEPIRTVGVIGAGVMGVGIIQQAATRGFAVGAKEADPALAVAGQTRLDTALTGYIRHKQLSDSKSRELRDRIHVGSDWDVVANVDCLVEAIVEKMEIKQDVLTRAERVLGRTSILATNTSALSITEMSKSLMNPERFAGLHFFNPVPRMELVEVVRGQSTSNETVDRLVAFVRALGKTPIVTTDSPGFLVNRILFPYLGQAILMLRHGFVTDQIDREMKRFGMPMGPLALLDQVGLDVAHHVADSLGTVMPEVETVTEILKPMLDRGEIGTKSGKGFYDYSEKKKRARSADELGITAAETRRVDGTNDDRMNETQRLLVYPMLAEAIRCRNESVVDHDWAIDLGMVLGTGFAPHLGGPISLLESIGEDCFRHNMHQLRNVWGQRYDLPEMNPPLADRVQST